MKEEFGKSKCTKCGGNRTSQNSGSITQWVSNCACTQLDTPTDQSREICQTCKKSVAAGRAGSLTQWIFRSDLCSCALPAVEKSRMAIAAEVAAAKKTSGKEIQPDEELEVDPERFPSERYAPLEILGSGMAGTVYLCRDRLLRKKVAIKLLTTLTPEQVVAFQGEARAASKLNHPNIVKVMDFGVTTGGIPFMVMEFVPGNDLSGILKQQKTISVTAALYIFGKVCDGLAEAHRHHIFHRDIKNSNILVGALENHKPDVRLIDFGVASFQPVVESQTAQGATLVGTPAYMSPDQALGKPYDARSEVYSIGCALFEALTGSPPFTADTALEVINKHAHEKPPGLSAVNGNVDFSDELEKVVARCLEKKPCDRYESMEELSGALTATALNELSDATVSLHEPESAKFAVAALKTPSMYAVIALAGIFLVAAVWQNMSSSPGSSNWTSQKEIKKAKRDGSIEQPKGSESSWRKAGRNPVVDHVFSFENGELMARGMVHDQDLVWLADHNTAYICNSLILGQEDSTECQKTITKRGWAAIGRIPVEKLVLTNCFLDDSDVKLILKNKNLKLLDLSRSGIGDRGVAFLKNSNLETLWLRGTRVTDQCIDSLATIPALKKLNVDGTSITDKGYEKIGKLKNIEWLDLSATHGTADGLKYIDQLPLLKALFIGRSSVGLNGIKNLSKLKLTVLSTSYDKSIDDQCLTLMSKQWPGLRSLYLERTSISGEGLKCVGKLKDITFLSLSTNNLKDEDVLPVLQLPKLQSIHLMLNPVTDKTAERIARNPSLKFVDLSESAVTRKGLQMLKARNIKYIDFQIEGIDTAQDVMTELLDGDTF